MAELISVFGTAQDITDRKLMEDALRVSLEKYRVLFESFPLGITISDKSGKIMEGNRQSEQLLGITREVHTQRRIDSKGWRIVRKDGTPMPADEYASTRALRENRLIENVEMGVVKDKGEITWISVTAAPIPLEGYGVAIAYGDITERKQIEKQLKHFQEMKILNLVVAGVAHEVRNPLNAILAVSEALFKDLGDNPEYQPYLDHIRTQVSRLSNLMKDLLELGRPVQLDLFQSHSLDELVKGAQALWQGAGFVTTHDLSIDLPGEAKKILIKTDPIRLQQALLNLLDNAAQNSPEGSTIDLSVQILNKKTCRIRIMDQGKGISPDYLPRVFDPFFTTRKGGTGLGLSLVKNFVESLGGRVAIWNNDPPPGCTLVVTLPIFTEREVLIHETHHPISG